MKPDPGMHIVMHLVFFGKTGVTRLLQADGTYAFAPPARDTIGGACRTVGAIQLRGFARFFEAHEKILIKLKLALQRHKFYRRCQTSQLNTMRSTFPACIIALIDTMLEKINRTSAFSEEN
jgi:hypothetical protein